MSAHREVVFIGSENGALPGGKVGGVGDVLRDLPRALNGEGWRTTVITPSYDRLHRLPGATPIGTIEVTFAGANHRAELFDIPGADSAVRNIVIEHELISAAGPGIIYVMDEPGSPFASDAPRFAFFCACAAAWINDLSSTPDVVHLHDWHAAFYCLLRTYDPHYRRLKRVRTVFTIHNLSYQGTRPLSGHASSLSHWFPALSVDERVRDPNFEDCVNPMAAAIRLADRISTVSPTYAGEICRPSDPASAFIGGEGLEGELTTAAAANRLHGILNGCFYDEPVLLREWPEVSALMKRQLQSWSAANDENEAHRLALQRLEQYENRPRHLLVSIGRLVAQKASLLCAAADGGVTTLQRIATDAGDKTLIVVLGSGEARFETKVLEAANAAGNILFLNGYAEELSDALYAAGDLFLMPSSFEPCGISQMLAMRAGQPCVVHGVGGLRDTVEHGFTGFVFSGDGIAEQAAAFRRSVAEALQFIDSQPRAWRAMRKAAQACRFAWSDAARATIEQLYGRSYDR